MPFSIWITCAMLLRGRKTCLCHPAMDSQILKQNRNRIFRVLESAEEIIQRGMRIARRTERRARRSLFYSVMAIPTHHSIGRIDPVVSYQEDVARSPGPGTMPAGSQVAAQNDLSDDTGLGSVFAAPQGKIQDERASSKVNLLDKNVEEVPLPSSDVSDSIPDLDTVSIGSEDSTRSQEDSPPFNEDNDIFDTSDTMTASSCDTGGNTLSTTFTDQGDLNPMSPTSNDDSEPPFESSPDTDDAEFNTGSDETNPQHDPSTCTHPDASFHSWNWSLIVYASAGVRIKCRACGEQRTEAEFSSLLERGEDGGARLNWEHVSRFRWWPGGGWSWG